MHKHTVKKPFLLQAFWPHEFNYLSLYGPQCTWNTTAISWSIHINTQIAHFYTKNNTFKKVFLNFTWFYFCCFFSSEQEDDWKAFSDDPKRQVSKHSCVYFETLERTQAGLVQVILLFHNISCTSNLLVKIIVQYNVNIKTESKLSHRTQNIHRNNHLKQLCSKY